MIGLMFASESNRKVTTTQANEIVRAIQNWRKKEQVTVSMDKGNYPYYIVLKWSQILSGLKRWRLV